MGEAWIVDGEALVMMMAMISSNYPSRQSDRTEFLVPDLGFAVAAEQQNSFWKNDEPPDVFDTKAIYRRKGDARRRPRKPHHV